MVEPERPSTKDDLLILNEYIKKESLKSVIVITSWYHIRRCQIVAKRLLSEKVKTYFVSANMPDMDYFISRTKRASGLFNAYIKLLYYYVTAF